MNVWLKFGFDVKSKAMQIVELLLIWVSWFVNCLSPDWEARFAILEPSWVALSLLHHRSDFAFKSSTATTKKGFLSKLYPMLILIYLWTFQIHLQIDLVIYKTLQIYRSFSGFLIRKHYIHADNECQVVSKIVIFCNTHTYTSSFVWMGGLLFSSHNSKFLNCHHQILCLNWGMLLADK